MSAHKAYIHLTLYVELTDNDDVADQEFDAVLDGVRNAVETVPRVYDESVIVADADTVTA